MGILSLIKKLISPKKERSLTPNNERLDKDKSLLEKINNSPLIRSEFKGVFFEKLRSGDMFKGDGDLLSNEEKKSLGYSSRLKINRALISTLTTEGMKYSKNPKDVITHIYYSSSMAFMMKNQIEKFRFSLIKKYRVSTPMDGRDCKWCESVHKKVFSSNVDFVELIEENCACFTHCRITLIAIIKGFD